MKGFTLIELLVTISIFIFMTALIVSRYGAFNQGTLMTNLAYDMALTIRTAQTYGVSVKGTYDPVQGASQTFTGSYGVHFDTSSSGAASSFLLFSDAVDPVTGNGNNVYNSLDGDTIIGSYTIKQGAKIVSNMCVSNNGGGNCNLNTKSYLDIAFKRPDPSAIISGDGSQTQPNPPYNYAKITLSSADGTSFRTVVVRGNGQISVGN